MTRGQRRSWLAIFLQDRRRLRQQALVPPPVPNAPVLLTGTYQWNRTSPGYADVMLTWSFDPGSFPVAFIEFWAGINSSSSQQLGTVASNITNLSYPNATAYPIYVRVKMRYRNGSVIGPFSNELLINIQAPS